jgi:hypothetical protein
LETGRVPTRGVSSQPGKAEVRGTQRATADSRIGKVSQSFCSPSACTQRRFRLHPSFCSSIIAPARWVIDASFGKMPATLVLRLITAFGRSSGFVELTRVQCAHGNDVNASTSCSAPSISLTSLGNYRHAHYAPGLACLHIDGNHPQVGPITFDLAVQNGASWLVEITAQVRALAPGDSAHARRLDKIVHRAGGDALDVGLLDHGGQRFLCGAPRGSRNSGK